MMRIGKVAVAAGVNIQTLRYYERRGLLPEPERGSSGYRAYGPDTVKVVRFIKRALAAAKVSDIEHRIRQLRAMRSALGGLVEACDWEKGAPTCPIIEALDNSALTVSHVGVSAGKE